MQHPDYPEQDEIFQPGREVIPGYKLICQLGQGGFGVVWKATAPGDTFAALKFLNLQGSAGTKELQGIQRVKEIRHPHLMPVTALWLLDDDGQVLDGASSSAAPSNPRATLVSKSMKQSIRPKWLVVAMIVANESLEDQLKRRRAEGNGGLDLESLLRYMEETAKGVDFLNASGHDVGDGEVDVQHCDIKPGNIMLLGDGVVICDFGLARVIDRLSEASPTATTMVGSPAYMSPECTNRKPGRWSDLYSLAVSYYELRTGELPFEDPENFGAVIAAHANGTLNLERLPEAEREVIAKATSVNAEDRHESAGEMVRELRRATQGLVSSERKGFGWLAVAIVFLLAAGCGIGGTLLFRQTIGANDTAKGGSEEKDGSADELARTKRMLAALKESLDKEYPRLETAGIEDVNAEMIRQAIEDGRLVIAQRLIDLEERGSESDDEATERRALSIAIRAEQLSGGLVTAGGRDKDLLANGLLALKGLNATDDASTRAMVVDRLLRLLQAWFSVHDSAEAWDRIAAIAAPTDSQLKELTGYAIGPAKNRAQYIAAIQAVLSQAGDRFSSHPDLLPSLPIDETAAKGLAPLKRAFRLEQKHQNGETMNPADLPHYRHASPGVKRYLSFLTELTRAVPDLDKLLAAAQQMPAAFMDAKRSEWVLERFEVGLKRRLARPLHRAIFTPLFADPAETKRVLGLYDKLGQPLLAALAAREKGGSYDLTVILVESLIGEQDPRTAEIAGRLVPAAGANLTKVQRGRLWAAASTLAVSSKVEDRLRGVELVAAVLEQWWQGDRADFASAALDSRLKKWADLALELADNGNVPAGNGRPAASLLGISAKIRLSGDSSTNDPQAATWLQRASQLLAQSKAAPNLDYLASEADALGRQLWSTDKGDAKRAANLLDRIDAAVPNESLRKQQVPAKVNLGLRAELATVVALQNGLLRGDIPGLTTAADALDSLFSDPGAVGDDDTRFRMAAVRVHSVLAMIERDVIVRATHLHYAIEHIRYSPELTSLIRFGTPTALSVRDLFLLGRVLHQDAVEGAAFCRVERANEILAEASQKGSLTSEMQWLRARCLLRVRGGRLTAATADRTQAQQIAESIAGEGPPAGNAAVYCCLATAQLATGQNAQAALANLRKSLLEGQTLDPVDFRFMLSAWSQAKAKTAWLLGFATLDASARAKLDVRIHVDIVWPLWMAMSNMSQSERDKLLVCVSEVSGRLAKIPQATTRQSTEGKWRIGREMIRLWNITKAEGGAGQGLSADRLKLYEDINAAFKPYRSKRDDLEQRKGDVLKLPQVALALKQSNINDASETFLARRLLANHLATRIEKATKPPARAVRLLSPAIKAVNEVLTELSPRDQGKLEVERDRLLALKDTLGG